MASTGMNFLPHTDMAPRRTFHQWFDDFDLYLATSWVITLINSSGPAIGATKDGILLFTNTTAALDSAILQARDVASGQVANHWVFTAGKRFYFGACFKVSDATNCNWFFGLTTTNTTPLSAVADGIYMQKTSAAATGDIFVAKSSTRSTATAIPALTANTYVTLEAYYDGVFAAIQFFADGVPVGGLPLTNAPTAALSLNFGMANVNAAANTMSVDWIEIMQERG